MQWLPFAQLCNVSERLIDALAVPLVVNVAKLAEIIDAHSETELTGERHKLDQDTVCKEYGWAILVDAENTTPIVQQQQRKLAHITQVLVECQRE